jgi:fluoride exporter
VSSEPLHATPIDPDVDLRQPAQRTELGRAHGAVLAVVAAGGGIGALARYGIGQLLPTRPGLFPWGTFTTNVSGCFLIGALMVLVTDVWTRRPLLRPLLGTGVLGGFTTFSTYTVETHGLLQPGHVVLAFGYLAGTLVCGLLATLMAMRITRAITSPSRTPQLEELAS